MFRCSCSEYDSLKHSPHQERLHHHITESALSFKQKTVGDWEKRLDPNDRAVLFYLYSAGCSAKFYRTEECK